MRPNAVPANTIPFQRCDAVICARPRATAFERKMFAVTRVNAASGKAGVRAMSAISAIASAARSLSASVPTYDVVAPDPVRTAPPSSDARAEIWSADCVAVPSGSSRAASVASPVSLAVSSLPPYSVTKYAVIFGTAPYGTSVTRMPLASV